MSYNFESPESFLVDFGVSATFGSYTATVILDQPDLELLGARAQGTEYEMLYRTSDLPGLDFGGSIVVNGTTYSVQFSKQLDDGVFSRARLQIGA